ncbi:hypothetical protein Aduo_012796 [Ancylostoma duodenale]
MACRSITALQNTVQTTDQPFEFPTTATECTVFIAEKMAEIDEIRLRLPELLEDLRTQMKVALSFIGERKDHSERERLMSDIKAFFNTAADETELLSIQWTGRLNYRARELEKTIQPYPSTTYYVCKNVSSGQ